MKHHKNSLLRNILKNKYFLYFIFIVSFFNILGYIASKNYKAILCFIIVAFITTYFNKNMAIVLTIAVITTIILSPLFGFIKEGLENNNNKENKKQQNNDDKQITITDTENVIKDEPKQDESEVQNTESLDTLNKGITGGSKKVNNSHIDLAATLEESYDNLNNMLGSEGINKLTEDTKKLMEQQSKLYKNMEAMTPLVGSAKKMLESFDMSKFNDILKSATSFK
jgi:hypothetical protein